MSTATERLTYDVPEAARLAGVSPKEADDEIRSTGALAGVPVIHIDRRILIPRAAFDRVLAGEPAAAPLTLWVGTQIRVRWGWVRFIAIVVFMILHGHLLPDVLGQASGFSSQPQMCDQVERL